jgi:hypothetical protein
MFFKAMLNIDTRLLNQVTESEMWLLLHLTKRLGRKMFCFPSNKTLCNDTGWSIDKLRDNKNSLIDKKIIRVVFGMGKSNEYHLKTDKIGVFVGADKLSTPSEKPTPPRRKNQHPAPSEKPTPKYYPIEVLTTKEGEHSKKEKDFYSKLVPFVGEYDSSMVRAFFDYWSEWDDKKNFMRWEINKRKSGVFDIARRLATWKKKENGSFGKTEETVYTPFQKLGE